MNRLIAALLIIAGIIHLMPLSGLLGAGQLTRLYGLDFNDPNLAILMRHRAVLFGLLGALLVYAAFNPASRPLAFIAGFISVLSFLWLAWSIGGYNALVGRIVVADIVALLSLVVALALHLWRRNAT